MFRNPKPNFAVPSYSAEAPGLEATAISTSSSNLSSSRRLPCRTFGGHAVVMTLALLIGAGGLAVHARQAQPDHQNLQSPLLTGQIACVDMERVYAASGGPEQLAQRATEVALEVTTHLKELKAVPSLEQNELQEYGALAFKATRTDGEQARMKELKTLSDQRQDELAKLVVKPDKTLTAEDKTRMRHLQEQSHLLESILPYWQEDARAQQTERIEAFRRTQMARLRVVVGKVAVERSIAHVFDTSALVYSANDLTSVVVQRVGKHAPKEKDTP